MGAGDPLCLQSSNDAGEIIGAPLRFLAHGSNRFLIPRLPATKGACAIGIAKLHASRLCCRKGGFGALADQAALELCDRGHLRQQETCRSGRDLRQIAEHDIGAALDENLGENFRITFDYRDAIARAPSGKYLDFVNEIPDRQTS